MTRTLVVQDLVSYHFPMLDGESRRQAMKRWLDIDDHDQFIVEVHARESWVINEQGAETPEEAE